MKKSSLAKFVTVALSASLVLSACGGKSGETPKEPEKAAAPSGPVSIDFWFAVGGKSQEWIKAATEKFNASQKDVVVTATYQGDYYTNHQKLSTALAANSAPAISMIEVASMPFFADNDVLADIGALAKGDEAHLKDFLPGLMKEAVWKGKTIAIPFNRSVPVLYINKNALKDAGLDPNGPKTWDELRDYAKRLTVVKDGKVERWGFLTPIDIWFYEAMVFQAGGSFYSSDMKKATFNDEAGQKALQFWVDLIHTDKVMEMPQGEKYNAWDVSTQAFTSGKAAMIFSTTGRLQSHLSGSKDKFEMGTAFLPAGPKGYGTPTGGANLVILNTVPKEQQQAAWKFLKWLTSPENAADFAKTTGYIPVNNGGIKLLEDYYKQVPQAKTAIDQLQYAQPRPQSPSYAEMQETVMKALQKAVLKEASVKDALDEAAALATKNLK
jgi:sn-glycerol 3-phosphate transport system substrate-binding protein